MSSLPIELWAAIFTRVDRQDLPILVKVCKTFYFASLITLDTILRGNEGLKPVITLTLRQDCSKTDSVFNLFPSRIDKRTCTFKISENGQFGFRGLSSKMQGIIKQILDDEDLSGRVDHKSYSELSLFLKNGWGSFRDAIPLTLRGAYQTLFSHILKTFDHLSEKALETMESELQLSLLAQIWRVVDILAPRSARDPRICFAMGCCDGLVEVAMETFISGDEIVSKTWHDLVSIGACEDVQTIWEWPLEKGSIKNIVTNAVLGPGVMLTVEALVHGENAEHLTIVDVELTINKLVLFSNKD